MAKRAEQFPYGIPGVDLTTVTREVPSTEPPAWPINDELEHVGKSVPRTDAALKVTGRAQFTADVRLPGQLYGKLLRSPHANARIRGIDYAAAQRYPGVYAVHVFHNRLVGATSDGSLHNEERGYPEVKFAGQAVCGVAAESMQVAEQAIRLIEVDYEVKPFVVTVGAARAEGAPLVYEEQVEQAETGGGGGGAEGLAQVGNVRGPNTESFLGGPRGNVREGLAAADVVAEGTFVTQVQTHSPLETHGIVADWKPNMLTVYASTQSTKGVRSELATIFDLPLSEVRVVCEYMGGGFGSKYSVGSFGVAAVELSRKTGRPVWLMLDRKEEHLAVGNRPNSEQLLRIGAKASGDLVAIEQESYGTAGIGLGAGVGRVAQALYPCPNFSTAQYDVFTHTGPGAAWRAPGNVQGAFAVEQLVDELAEKLGRDPMEYRDQIDDSKVRREERRRIAERFKWAESRKRTKAQPDGPVRRGVGLAQATWPRLIDVDSTAEVRLFKDGTVEVRSSVMDIGTGTRTILTQVVAEELGLDPSEVYARIGDTNFPAGPASGGSKATGSITPAARNAAYKAWQQLRDEVAGKWEVEPEQVSFEQGRFGESLAGGAAGRSMSFKDALKGMRTQQITVTASRSDDYGGFRIGKSISHSDLGSVQAAEVSVNTETGFVKVERIVAAHSCGRPLNPKQVQSQVNGGIIHGLSYALYEDRLVDENTGRMVNHNLDQYKIAFSMEMPEIEVINIEEYSARSSTDAFGIAEPANISTAAAIANAVYDAIGVRIYELPITPARVLKALGKA